MLAALYARVSTTEQAEEGHSIEAQLGAMRDHCERMGWEVGATYVDAGVSAKLQNRPRLDCLMRDAKAKRFGVVVVHKLDRFYRNQGALWAALRTLAELNIDFVSVSENIDLNSVGGKVVAAVLGAMAEVYVDNLSAETSKGKRQRAKEGLTNASIVPYGYCRSESGGLVHEPSEAEAIRLAFEAYATGKYTDKGIATLLNDNGYRTRYTTQWKSRPWTKDTITITLKNSFYVGQVRHGDKLYQGQHEPLISRETWDRVQSIRAERCRVHKTASPVYRVYLLNGFARCSVCKSKLRVQHNYNYGYSYYRHTAKSRGIECTQPDCAIRQEKLAGQVDSIISGLSIPDDWQKRLRAGGGCHGHEGQTVEQERDRLEKKLERLKRAWLDLELTDEEYQAERQRVRDRLAAITPPEAAELAQAAITLRTMGDVWPRATLEEKRDMLRLILTAVYVDVTTGEITGLEPKPAFAEWVHAGNQTRGKGND